MYLFISAEVKQCVKSEQVGRILKIQSDFNSKLIH